MEVKYERDDDTAPTYMIRGEQKGSVKKKEFEVDSLRKQEFYQLSCID